MKWLFPFLLFVFWGNGLSSVSASFRVVCYYDSLAAKRDKEARFMPSNVDPRLCTDFVYAFAQVTDNTVKPIGDTTEQYRLYSQMVDLKKGHSHKSTFLSITNWRWRHSMDYDQLTQSIVQFLRLHKFDGLDISSELPSKDEIQPFSTCIHTIRQAFEQEASLKSIPRLLLTARLSRVWEDINHYNVTTINANLDWVNLMTFDFHQKYPNQNIHHSLLFPTRKNPSFLNIQTTIGRWIKQGLNANKIFMGVGFFARIFQVNVEKSETPTLGFPGKFTKTKSLLAYSEVCQLESPEETVNGVDGPYVVSDSLWAGYDNQQSLSLKVKWAIENGLGGMSVWSVDLDDFTGKFCRQGPFPLLLSINLAKRYLFDNGVSSIEDQRSLLHRKDINKNVHAVNFSLLPRKPVSLLSQDQDNSSQSPDFSQLKRKPVFKTRQNANTMDDSQHQETPNSSNLIKETHASQYEQSGIGSVHTVDISLLGRKTSSSNRKYAKEIINISDLKGHSSIQNGAADTADFSLLKKRPNSKKHDNHSTNTLSLEENPISRNVQNRHGSVHTVDFSFLRKRPDSPKTDVKSANTLILKGDTDSENIQNRHGSVHTVDFSLLKKRPVSLEGANIVSSDEQGFRRIGRVTNFQKGKPNSSKTQTIIGPIHSIDFSLQQRSQKSKYKTNADLPEDFSLEKEKSTSQAEQNIDGSEHAVDFSLLGRRNFPMDSKAKTSVHTVDFSTLKRQRVLPAEKKVRTSVHAVDFSMLEREPAPTVKNVVKTSVHTADFSMLERKPVSSPEKKVKTSVHTVDFSMFEKEPMATPERKVNTSVHTVDFSMLMKQPVPTPKHGMKTAVHTVDFSMLMGETSTRTIEDQTGDHSSITPKMTTTIEPSTTPKTTTTMEPTITPKTTTTMEPTITPKTTTTMEPTRNPRTTTTATTTATAIITKPTTTKPTTVPLCMLSLEEPITIKPQSTEDEIRTVRLAAILKKTKALQLITEQKDISKFSKFCHEMEDDFYNHWNKCNKYILCVNGSTLVGTCARGFRFNLENVTCDEDTVITCTDLPEPSVTTENPPVQKLSMSKEMIIKDFCTGKADNYYAHPVSCTFYILCVKEEYFLGHCQPGYYFNSQLNKCDKAEGKDCVDEVRKEVEEKVDQPIFERKCRGIANGKYPHPTRCNLYILCLDQQLFIGRCQRNMHFSTELKICDHSTRFDCKDKDDLSSLINSSYITVMEFSVALLTQIGLEDKCKGIKNGEYPHPAKCGLFILCFNQRMFIGKCPGDSLFSTTTRICEADPNFNCSANRFLPGSTLRKNDETEKKNSPSGQYPTLDGNCNGIQDGEYPHPTRCDQFILCFGQQMLIGICPKGRMFSMKTRLCGHPENSDCKVKLSKKDLVTRPTFDGKCRGVEDGQYVHPTQCTMFLLCFQQKMLLGICPSGRYFSKKTKKCEEQTNVNCNDKSIKSSTDLAKWNSPMFMQNTYVVVPTFDANPTPVSTPSTINLEKFCILKDDGLYQHPNDCHGFIQCSNWRTFIKQCPENLNFNDHIKKCDYFHNVQCSDGNLVTMNDSREQLPSRHDVHIEIGEKRNSEKLPISRKFPTLFGLCVFKEDGIYVHPYYCNLFLQCSNWQTFTKLCPDKLKFNPNINRCDYSLNVDCSDKKTYIKEKENVIMLQKYPGMSTQEGSSVGKTQRLRSEMVPETEPIETEVGSLFGPDEQLTVPERDSLQTPNISLAVPQVDMPHMTDGPRPGNDTVNRPNSMLSIRVFDKQPIVHKKDNYNVPDKPSKVVGGGTLHVPNKPSLVPRKNSLSISDRQSIVPGRDHLHIPDRPSIVPGSDPIQIPNRPSIVLETDPLHIPDRQSIVPGSDPIQIPNRPSIVLETDPLHIPDRSSIVPGSDPIHIPNRLSIVLETDPLHIPDRQSIVPGSDPIQIPNRPSIVLETDPLHIPDRQSIVPGSDPIQIPNRPSIVLETDPLHIPDRSSIVPGSDPIHIPNRPSIVPETDPLHIPDRPSIVPETDPHHIPDRPSIVPGSDPIHISNRPTIVLETDPLHIPDRQSIVPGSDPIHIPNRPSIVPETDPLHIPDKPSTVPESDPLHIPDRPSIIPGSDPIHSPDRPSIVAGIDSFHTPDKPSIVPGIYPLHISDKPSLILESDPLHIPDRPSIVPGSDLVYIPDRPSIVSGSDPIHIQDRPSIVPGSDGSSLKSTQLPMIEEKKISISQIFGIKPDKEHPRDFTSGENSVTPTHRPIPVIDPLIKPTRPLNAEVGTQRAPSSWVNNLRWYFQRFGNGWNPLAASRIQPWLYNLTRKQSQTYVLAPELANRDDKVGALLRNLLPGNIGIKNLENRILSTNSLSELMTKLIRNLQRVNIPYGSKILDNQTEQWISYLTKVLQNGTINQDGRNLTEINQPWRILFENFQWSPKLSEQKKNMEIEKLIRALFQNLYKSKGSNEKYNDVYNRQMLMSVLQKMLRSPEIDSATLLNFLELFRRHIRKDANQGILLIDNSAKDLQTYILAKNESFPQNGKAKPQTNTNDREKNLNGDFLRMLYPLIRGQNEQTLSSRHSTDTRISEDSSGSNRPIQSTNSFNICLDAADGFYIHPTNCYMYIKCQKHKMTFQRCPRGLKFDCFSRKCQYGAVTCKVDNPIKKGPTPTENHSSPSDQDATSGSNVMPHEISIKNYCTRDVQDGVYIYPSQCNMFILCSTGRTFVQTCPAGLLFNPILKQCDYQRNVDCIGMHTKT